LTSTVKPSIQVIKNMYLGLQEAFHTYSEHFIFYYIYSVVKDTFSQIELLNVLGKESFD